MNISSTSLENIDQDETISLANISFRQSSYDAINLPEFRSVSSHSLNLEIIPLREKIKRGLKKIFKTPRNLVLFCVSVVIVLYGSLWENEEITYTKTDRRTNETDELYTRKVKKTYPVIFNLGFALLGIILGVVVERCCLFIEERSQLENRYKSFTKLWKLCFGGIAWKRVVIIAVITGASLGLGRDTSPSLKILVLILGGIGVGPLLMVLLDLNKLSDVTVSRILEKQKMYPGYILAWSYYFNTLKKEMDNFNNLLKTHKLAKLSLARMILLTIPGTDIKSIEDLIAHDNMIELSDTDSDNNNQFPIYKLQQKNKPKYFAMACVREPLVALKKMRDTNKVLFVTDTTFDDELKRFYKTLSEILENAPDDEYTKKGFLVPVTVKSGRFDKLNNGGLVRIIMKKVNESFALKLN